MAILSICPKCKGSIQLSEDSSDPNETIRCPKCKETFPLHEALDIMAESPPEAKSVKAEGKGAPPAVPNFGPAGAGAPVRSTAPEPVAHAYDEDDRTVEAESTSGRLARNRRREPSMLFTMGGVVIGGAMGIYLGAYVLNYLGIPLPDPVRNLPGMAVAPAKKVEDEDSKKSVAKVEPPPEVVEPAKTEPPPPAKPPEIKAPEKAPPVEPPTPKKPAAPELGVKDGPTFTPAQLGATLGEANKASGGQIGKSAGPAILDATVYAKLCELAERATFVRAETGDTSLEARKRGTQDVIKRIVNNQENVAKLGALGTQKLAEGAPAERGIVLCGIVSSIEQQGKLVTVDLTLYGGGKQATVVCPIRGGMKRGDKVVILGAIVDSPVANLAGYSGDDRRVVWGGMPVEIPASTFR